MKKIYSSEYHFHHFVSKKQLTNRQIPQNQTVPNVSATNIIKLLIIIAVLIILTMIGGVLTFFIGFPLSFLLIISLSVYIVSKIL